jgi:hypothetical protein
MCAFRRDVDRCRGLTLMAEFLTFSCFYFCFCILTTHVLDLVYTKKICSLNVIVHELFYDFVTFITFGYDFSELYAQ